MKTLSRGFHHWFNVYILVFTLCFFITSESDNAFSRQPYSRRRHCKNCQDRPHTIVQLTLRSRINYIQYYFYETHNRVLLKREHTFCLLYFHIEVTLVFKFDKIILFLYFQSNLLCIGIAIADHFSIPGFRDWMMPIPGLRWYVNMVHYLP